MAGKFNPVSAVDTTKKSLPAAFAAQFDLAPQAELFRRTAAKFGIAANPRAKKPDASGSASGAIVKPTSDGGLGTANLLFAVNTSGGPRRVSSTVPQPNPRQAQLIRAAQPLPQNPAIGDAASVNIAALTNSQAFRSLSASPQVQSELLAAAKRFAGDGIYTQGLQNLAGRLQGLAPIQQADAIKAFEQVANSEAYQGKPGGWFTSGTTVSDVDKGRILANTAQVVTSQGFQEVKPDVQNAMLAAVQNHDNAATQNILALTNSQRFRGLDPVTQKDVLGVMDRRANGQAFRNNLTDLIGDPGFAALSAQNAQQAPNLVNAYGNDGDFSKGVDVVRGSSNYTNLNGTSRSKVLDDITKLASTVSYASASEPYQPNYKPDLIRVLGNMSAKAEANPGNKILRNTANKIVNGKVNLALFAMSGTDAIGGYQDEGGIHKNMNPEFADEDVIPHEVNHTINNDYEKFNNGDEAREPERVYAEYRAHNAGKEAALGRPLTAAEQLRILDTLLGPKAGYWEMQDFYNKNKNPAFTAAVNRMYNSLRNGIAVPPVTAAEWFGVDAGNLDNH